MSFDMAADKLYDFTKSLKRIPESVKPRVTDICLRADRPLVLKCGRRHLFVGLDGMVFTEPNKACVFVTREDIASVFYKLCGYSVYSHIDEIRHGFISVNGLRVGITGTSVTRNCALQTVRDITALSIRIPREVIGCAEAVLRHVDPFDGVLIAGAPSSGKTTLLRDIARILGHDHRTVVLDERLELSSDGFDLGRFTDVLRGYPKKDAFSHAIRCLSPEFILCDELEDSDMQHIKSALFAGVVIIATVHAGSIHDLKHRPLCRELINTGAFRRIVHISSNGSFTGNLSVLTVGELCEDIAGADDNSGRLVRWVV